MSGLPRWRGARACRGPCVAFAIAGVASGLGQVRIALRILMSFIWLVRPYKCRKLNTQNLGEPLAKAVSAYQA